MVLCPKTGLSLLDELHYGRRDRDVILFAFDLLEVLISVRPPVDRKAMLGKHGAAWLFVSAV